MFFFFFLFSLCTCALAQAATTITGNVSLQQHGQDEWVTLHGTDGKGYVLTGDLLAPLKKITQEKPAFNLVTVTGVLSTKNTISCERKRNLTASSNNQQQLQEDVICVRYYYFEPRQILSVAESTTPLPPLARDSMRETQMLAHQPAPSPTPAITGEIYGTITESNFRSPIKNIVVKNREQNSLIPSLTIIITADTRVVKNIGTTQPVSLPADSLTPGQHVTVMYSTNEIRTEALYITITKE